MTTAINGDAGRSRVRSRVVDDLPPQRITLLDESVIVTEESLYVAVHPASHRLIKNRDPIQPSRKMCPRRACAGRFGKFIWKCDPMRSCSWLDVHQATYVRYAKETASCARIGIYRKTVGLAGDVGKIASYKVYGTRAANYVVNRQGPAPLNDPLLLPMLRMKRSSSNCYIVPLSFR